MTNREKAIVMAHTGICMLSGGNFQIFHKYVEDIMGGPVFLHELPFLEDEIKKKSKPDFMSLCEESEEKGWIKTSDKTPKQYERVLVSLDDGWIDIAEYCGNYWMVSGEYYYIKNEIPAWQPLPNPYKAESEDKNEYI